MTKSKNKKKNKIRQTPSPMTKFSFLKFFFNPFKAPEREICNEPIYVDSEGECDGIVLQKENDEQLNNCQTRKIAIVEQYFSDGLDIGTPQKKNSNDAIDHDAKVIRDTRTLQKEFCNEAIDLDTEAIDLVSESSASGVNSFPARSRNDQGTTPCSKNDVSIATISDDDDDDDERTEMNPVTAVSSLKQNEVLLRGESAHGFGGPCHIEVTCREMDKYNKKFYTKGEQDAVVISQREIELLQPQRFINDDIIDFYINLLKKKIAQENRQRFHFFNCFFFKKMADLDKKPFRASEGRAAFERVRTWTKEVNLFEKDYIFIPINFRFHWSLVVICHPGEVVRSKDKVDISPKKTFILHMNSIKGTHRGLTNLFQSYLCELWKEKHGVTAENVSSKFLRLRFIQPELPQQENMYDCGLFLLHYLELFLKEAPAHFNSVRKSKSNFLGKNWFPPAEASRKRAEIRELINGIFANGSQEVSPAVCGDKYSSIQLPNTNEQETEIDTVEKICSSAKRCHVSTPGSVECTNGSQEVSSANCGDKHSSVQLLDTNKQDTEKNIIEDICSSTKQCHVSTPRSVKCTRESGLIYGGLFEAKTTAKSPSDDKYTTSVWQRSIMSPIEELSESDKVSELSVNRNQNSTLLDTEDCLLQKLDELSQADGTKKCATPSTSSEKLAGYVVDDSEASDVEESEVIMWKRGSIRLRGRCSCKCESSIDQIKRD